MIFFSVILATRNRPGLFNEALLSVCRQKFEYLEIIVINDGSDEKYTKEYSEITDLASKHYKVPVRVYRLLHRPNGHGQSYSLNYGVSLAKGRYVCFLDDDDKWVDNNHLKIAYEAIIYEEENNSNVDLYMTNQEAFVSGKKKPGEPWLASLEKYLKNKDRSHSPSGAYRVDQQELMSVNGFCHLNTFIVRKNIYDQVGGMDEGIRWECDLDLYLRLTDHSGVMLYMPKVISRHNVPDPNRTDNMSTTVSTIEKMLFRLRVHDKAALFSGHEVIRRSARIHKGYTLKKIAEALAKQKRYKDASYYAREALGVMPGLRWTGYIIYLKIINLMRL